MARYNSIQVSGNVGTATTIIAPSQGLFTEFTGTAPYSVTIPNPTIYTGGVNTYYNSTAGNITLITPAGVYVGPGVLPSQTSIVMPPTSAISLASNGTNYIVVSFDGGPQTAATNGQATYALGLNGDIIQSAATVNFMNANASTINAWGAGTNINIGATTGTTTINNSLYVKGGVVTVNSSQIQVEDKTIEIGFVNPISYGSGTISVVRGVLSGSTTFTSPSGVKVSSAATYSSVPQFSSSGQGTGATFNVTTTGSGTNYTGFTTITLVSGGSGYAIGDTVQLPGSNLGGVTTTNNLTFTIGNVLASPWTSTITGITDTTNLVSGASVSATNGTGSLGSGGSLYYISSILGGTSIVITSVGGVVPTVGTITNITPGSADLFANGGGMTLRGTTDKTFLWSNTATGPLSGNTAQASWVTSEGLHFGNSTASNMGIQTFVGGGTGFNMLTNGVTTGTFNLATDAVTVAFATAATTFTIGKNSSGVTTNIQGSTVNFNSTTTINAASSPTFTATGLWGQWSKAGFGTTADPGAGAILATGNITAYYSDDRLKTRLGNIENALEKLETLTGFYYEANELAQSLGYEAKREVGVSAQEVNKIMPEIVRPAPIDAKYMTIHYEKLLPLVIEAVKELSSIVKDIKTQIGKE
jgi:hypothetical protein